MTQTAPTIAVLGAGSWGTALALVLAHNQINVQLWGHEASQMQALMQARENKRYLPGYAFPDNITICDTLAHALEGVSGVLIVVPSHAFASLLKDMLPFNIQDVPLAWGTKGLDEANLQLLSETAAELLGAKAQLSILSGPSFATEVAAQQPTAVTLASHEPTQAQFWQHLFHNEFFRVYTSDDMVGVQLGGAVKNVLAIAVGIADGLGFGANARAALMARGFAELLRLGEAMGAQTATLTGLAGMGDLVLTCTDNQSRNRRFGVALGQGLSPEKIAHDIGQIIEGKQTTALIYQLAQNLHLDMPITEQVYQVLFANKAPQQAVKDLLLRQAKQEIN